MLFLLLALVSLAGLGVCHKVADFYHCKPGAISTTLFFTAAFVLWLYTLLFEVLKRETPLFPPFTAAAVLVAVLCGALAGVAILTFQKGVRYGRISTSWLVINLSTLVPALLSMVIYQEWKLGVKWQQIAGLVLMLLSMLLLWRDKVVELSAPQRGFEVVELETAGERSTTLR
jgi:drug/metabolite transporter (DMT)-like permease